MERERAPLFAYFTTALVPNKLAFFFLFFAANLTREVKDKMQEEARTKYGLTAEQIKDASDQVDELIAEAQATAAANQEDAGLLSKFFITYFLSFFIYYTPISTCRVCFYTHSN